MKDKYFFIKRPSFIITMSFVWAIMLGAIILSLPISSATGEHTSFVTSLFTATSATCVTGLIVVNTATHWSLFGKIVILFLIQIGGLGTMTIFSILLLFFKRKIGLKHRILIKEALNLNTYTGIVKFIKNVIFFAFTVEAIGALLLMTRFVPLYGVKGIWFSIFHSISAFCNAGFDLFGNSLMNFKGDFLVNVVICALVIIGGLGFIVFFDIYDKKSLKNITLHSKLSLYISIILLIIGTFLFIWLEYNNVNSIKELNFKDTILAGIFQSTVARTAGFNTVDISTIHDSTAFMLTILMFIGASSASTGGGIKTTTFGILLLATYSILRGKDKVVVYRRTIKKEAINKAVAILVSALIVICISSFMIASFEHERFQFIDVLFESVSAFATVGTSRSITNDLSTKSHLVIIIVMLIGRLGPFTIANGITGNTENKLEYANAEVLVG